MQRPLAAPILTGLGTPLQCTVYKENYVTKNKQHNNEHRSTEPDVRAASDKKEFCALRRMLWRLCRGGLAGRVNAELRS